jgi:hypothetical protein
MGGCGETLEDLKTRILTCTHLGIVYVEWTRQTDSNASVNSLVDHRGLPDAGQ